jgi:UDP-2-acetamido-2-deoxy-ribo-hexuluronate aminotransferase
MNKIQMVDLKSQYEKIKTEIDSGIQEVINNTQFIKGPQIKVFEDNLAAKLGVKHVISCANGTDALQIAMMALDLKPGDEVILPVFTYVATAEVIALLGLIPIMVDVNEDTFCIDTNLIESKISPKTKAIVPVHLFGQCANMNEVMRIARKHNLFVIEDTAQAIGSEYHFSDVSENAESDIQTSAKAGTMGHIGTTSFFPSKNLGCYGDGGALMTNDDELATKIRIICNHGQRVQYVHDVIGVNSRLDSIQAAILNAKLPHLKDYEVARQNAASLYDELLGNHTNIVIPKRDPNSTHVFHQYTIKLKGIDRDKIRSILAENGIPSMIYYPIELHKQKAFEIYHKEGESFPVSAELCQTVLSLPMHTELCKETVSFIARHVLESVDSLRA